MCATQWPGSLETVVQPVAQFTKLWLNCLGSDPCLCNSEVRPAVDTIFWDYPFDFLLVVFLTLSGFLELPFPCLQPKCWGFSFSNLLGISYCVWDTTCLVRILSTCRATLAVIAVTTTTMVCLGLEVGEREKRKWGFPTLTLKSPFLLLRPAIESSKRSSLSSQLMSISRFWLP